MELAADRMPIDQLAQLEYDKGILFFGIVPIVVICAFAAVCVVLYFYRRSKNWNDLGEAMRLDDEPETPQNETFATGDIAEMEPTKPSQRMTGISRHD